MRMLLSFISGCLLVACEGHKKNDTAPKGTQFSQISFSETVDFPIKSVVIQKFLIRPSCIWVEKTLPIYSDDEFISFRHQDCKELFFNVKADQGSVKMGMGGRLDDGEELREWPYLPIEIVTGNMKPPKEYLEDLYSTDEERRYCVQNEIIDNVWEIRNAGFLTIPASPRIVDYDIPDGLSKREIGDFQLQAIMTNSIEHEKKHADQRRINLICEKLPSAHFLFFKNELVLKLPKTTAAMFDDASLKYHKN